MRAIVLGSFLALTAAAVTHAEPPIIDNVELEIRVLSSSLEAQVTSWSSSRESSGWLAWQVPMTPGEHSLCCARPSRDRSRVRSCILESDDRNLVFSSERRPAGRTGSDLLVLIRAAASEVSGLRAYSEDCHLDAVGQPLIWLEGVPPEESAEFLAALVDRRPRVADDALMTLSLHATPRAAEELTRLARQHADAERRGAALFWLAQTGAATSQQVILQAVAEDPSESVREEAVFALSLLPEGQGLPALLDILRDGSRPDDIREHAFFWYVQTADDQALDLIAEILGG
jgi:hypothetical protein